MAVNCHDAEPSQSRICGSIVDLSLNVLATFQEIRDVMALAGHANLQTTERYISQDAAAQKNLVNTIYQNIR